MIRNLILTGGPAHEYDKTAPVIADFLRRVGVESEVSEDFDRMGGDGLQDFDLLTLYCTRATYVQVPKWTDDWGFHLSEAAREGILSFLGDGKGLLALHAASGCFDDWPEYQEIIGAWWEWAPGRGDGRHSSHPPVQALPMKVNSSAHQVVHDISDFDIVDELFMNLRFTDEVNPLVQSRRDEVDYPVTWVRRYGGGSVYYNALGHGLEAVENPVYQRLIERGALWAAGKQG